LDGLVDISNFAFAEVLDITVFSLGNSHGVDVSFLDLDDSFTAMAFFEAVSLVLFSALMKAFNITSEFSSNLLGSLSEISSHGFLSLLVLCLGNLEFFSSSLEKSFVGSTKVLNIGLVFLGKSLLSWLWKFIEVGSTSGFSFNASSHHFVVNGIKFSIEDERVNALSSDFFVAVSGNGLFLKENDVILSNWFVVFSEDDVLSNFV
jgi:hypothetical protein